MGKRCDVVYRRNKKDSNIPQLIRYSLVKSILVEHMTVKEAAQKWHVHYSSAKEIARSARRSNIEDILEQERYQLATQRASWMPLEKVESPQTIVNDQETLTNAGKTNLTPIHMVSTVGWDFFKRGQPK